MLHVLLLAAIVVGINLLPAFAPPTWAVLVALRLTWGIAAVPLVVVGALAATTGRVLLALAARRLRERLPAERRASLETLAESLERRRAATAGMLALFLLSPLPSGQLWTAAGLTPVRLRLLAPAFLAGRLVSYSIYVGAASAASGGLRHALGDAFSSPLGVALQVVLLVALVALVKVDWAALATRNRRPSVPSAPRAPGRPPRGGSGRRGRRASDAQRHTPRLLPPRPGRRRRSGA